MGYREAKELAFIRTELRQRLMSMRHEGSEPLLARMLSAAEGDADLRSEYERWRLRFDLLAVTG